MVVTEESLTTEKIFITLCLLNVGCYSFNSLFSLASANFAEGYVAIKRIQAFLNSKELDGSGLRKNGTSSCHGLQMDNVTASWTQGIPEATLRCVNLCMKEDELGVIIGPVGSGKVLGQLKTLSHSTFTFNTELSYKLPFGRAATFLRQHCLCRQCELCQSGTMDIFWVNQAEHSIWKALR